MTRKTVWVVEEGCYSDYRVVGVFSSQENAQLIADTCVKGATIAEWLLDPAVHELRSGFSQYFVQMQEDGTVDRLEEHEIPDYELNGEVRMWRRSQAPAYKGQGLADVLWATVWASDKAHAVKIANERRTRMIGTGEWAGLSQSP